MDTSEFEASRPCGRVWRIRHQKLPNTYAATVHAHPFDVAALDVEGEITLTCAAPPAPYRRGEIFTMAKGTEHFESVGAQGVKYWRQRA